MKKILFLLAAVMTLAACDKNDDGNKKNETGNRAYVGTVVVDPGTAQEYSKESVSVEVTISDDEKSVTIKMLRVKFAENMPVELDMTIPDVALTKTAEGFSMSGGEIVPLALGGVPFPQYTITGLTGELTASVISFDMMCGTFPTSFSGQKDDK